MVRIRLLRCLITMGSFTIRHIIYTALNPKIESLNPRLNH